MSGEKSRVLVVEDDPSVRNLISTALSSSGYEALLAPNGKAGIAQAAIAAPCVILLDLGLPDIDGIEVLRKVRSWSDLPVIVVSARGDASEKVNVLDEGADDYLTKPFSVEELLARLRAVLRRREPSAARGETLFTDGELEIDFGAGIVRRSGAELHLTPLEYKLICLLAHNVDKVLTHQYILQEVWGSYSESNLASLRVFMGTLRRKIEPDPSNPQYLHTHIGVGYRLSRV